MITGSDHHMSRDIFSASGDLSGLPTYHHQHSGTKKRVGVFVGSFPVEAKQARDTFTYVFKSLGQYRKLTISEVGRCTIFLLFLQVSENTILKLPADLKLSIEELKPDGAGLLSKRSFHVTHDTVIQIVFTITPPAFLDPAFERGCRDTRFCRDVGDRQIPL